MAKIKLTKNELKVQKDALKMYKRYLPTLMLKKQQLQTEIRTIDAKAKEVRAQRVALEKEFEQWISVFGEREAFTPDMVTVKNIKKGVGNIAGVTIPVYEYNDPQFLEGRQPHRVCYGIRGNRMYIIKSKLILTNT